MPRSLLQNLFQFLNSCPMLAAILKAKEAIQEPLECPTMTRKVVYGPAAYPVKITVVIKNRYMPYGSVPLWWASASSAPPWWASV